MLFFLSWVLPWIWLSLGALSGFLHFRGYRGALPLMWCFLALGVGDLASNWMADRSIHNIWVDRGLTFGITGGLLSYIDDHPWSRWAILGGGFILSCVFSGASSFGLITPLVIFTLVGVHVWRNLQLRTQGGVRGDVHWLVGNAGWAWLAVLKVFADHALAMSPTLFLIYWLFVTFGSILVMLLMLGGVYASDNAN